MTLLRSKYTPQMESTDYVHPSLLKLWIARGVCLLPDDQQRDILTGTTGPHASIRQGMGLTSARAKDEPFDCGVILSEVIASAEEESDIEQGILFANLKLLGRRIGLSPTEIRFLAFRVLYRLDPGLGELMHEKMFPGWTDVSLYKRMSRILGDAETAIERATSPSSVLIRTQLLTFAEVLVDSYEAKTGLAPGLINTLIRPHRSVFSLMKFLISTVPAGSLSLDDYPHLETEIRLLRTYLKVSTGNRRKGIHILLHGAPGTGKTELAKAICHDLGWKLYGLNSDTGDLGSNNGAQRLRALATAQKVLISCRKAAILFDEIDDVLFADVKVDGKPILTKQFMNRFLEDAPVPVFWITNHPARIDPAYVRRFDFSLEVTNPPRSVRKELLSKSCEGMLVPVPWLEQQAGIEQLTPALLARMGNVARLTANSTDSVTTTADGFTDAFGTLRDQYFRVYGQRANIEEEHCLLDYDASAINTTLDPIALSQQLRIVGSARLLFHGIPGSGKSAFARVMAKAIDRPLIPKQASDLLSPYLGETEQNIRKVFELAKRESGVLLIDEVDSFLQSRERAVRSWEVTQVNEFLTQLERFEGIVVCTTNFIAHLDAAAMRRFDSKIEFRPLRIEQCEALFRQLCFRLDVDTDNFESHEALRQLKTISTMTPGDFATVARQIRLSNTTPGPLQIVAALLEEQHFKPSRPGNGMGFVH